MSGWTALSSKSPALSGAFLMLPRRFAFIRKARPRKLSRGLMRQAVFLVRLGAFFIWQAPSKRQKPQRTNWLFAMRGKAVFNGLRAMDPFPDKKSARLRTLFLPYRIRGIARGSSRRLRCSFAETADSSKQKKERQTRYGRRGRLRADSGFSRNASVNPPEKRRAKNAVTLLGHQKSSLIRQTDRSRPPSLWDAYKYDPAAPYTQAADPLPASRD